jgi:hypothetical protein
MAWQPELQVGHVTTTTWIVRMLYSQPRCLSLLAGHSGFVNCQRVIASVLSTAAWTMQVCFNLYYGMGLPAVVADPVTLLLLLLLLLKRT